VQFHHYKGHYRKKERGQRGETRRSGGGGKKESLFSQEFVQGEWRRGWKKGKKLNAELKIEGGAAILIWV